MNFFFVGCCGYVKRLYICAIKSNTNNKHTMKAQFEIGKTYEAIGYYGDTTFTVISRTEKTVTIQTYSMGVKSVKIRNVINDMESICYGAWMGTPDRTA